jgi:ligand-binding sensor domain-containing protein/signal transduction histidine kinase
MRRTLKHCCLILLLNFSGGAISLPAALLSEFTQRVWQVRDGLPDQVVQAIVQTPDHYLWIGTTTGLVRFDGRNFVPYSGPGEEALRNGVTSLLVAHDQSLYIGTEGSGLLRYQNGRMQEFSVESGLRIPIVRGLMQDRAGNLWVGADRGLYRANGNGFDRVGLLKNFPDMGVAAVLQDRSGAIWYGGSKLVRVSQDGPKEYVLPSQNGSMRIKALGMGADGSVWIGAVAGLFHQLPSGGFAKVQEIHGTVRTFGRMPSGAMWVGTVGHGVYVQGQSGFTQIAAPDPLPSNTILCQATDSEGNLWIGTQSGLLRLSRSGMQLTPLPHGLDSDFGTLMRDTDGSLWICSSHLFHMAAGRITRYRFPELPEVTVRTMLRERSGALWIGTAGQGAYRIATNGQIAHYTAEIGTNYIRGFLQARDGSVWIATDGGVSRFQDGHIADYHEIVNSPQTLVLALAEGQDGRIWIGTHRGLMFFSQGAYHEASIFNGLRNQSVWALHVDDTGAVWIGADSGLYRLKDGTLYHFDDDAGGIAAGVYQILEDPNGLWIGGPTRVVRVARASLDQVANGQSAGAANYQAFPVSNEIQAAELYGGMQPAGVLEPDGTAWFASSQGPIHLLPNEKPADAIVPLAINRVLVDGRASSPESLDLPPGTKTLEIDYSPIVLSSQTDLQFRHKLEGFDDWSAPSSARSAIYTNLPAGHFTFLVQALYRATPAELTVIAIPVQQHARFYRRAWFWGLSALGIFSVIWGIHRLRVRRIRMRFRTIADERNRLAREMHDTVIQSCTGVSALLEAFASTTTVAEPTQHLLDYARQQIRVTIDQARDAVWNLRAHEIQPLDLDLSLRRLLDLLVKPAGLSIGFEREGIEPALDRTVVYELLMSTREALLNATTHSSATRIDLKLASSSSELTVSVSDNGDGFCVEDALSRHNRHYGLQGMRERMESIGGAFQLGSSVGGGTQLVFRIPLDRVKRRTPNALEV